MSDPQIDPAGNTQQFRAFAQRKDPEETAQEKRSPVVPIVVAVLAVLIVAAVAAYLIL
ncbi:hypothetical protein GCM10010466_14990 [Planomonospora alba]|uniref:Uncharacterized protein n=1 Tax=Planomonospora alba TaxID=161354 RepID=A0ABP6MT18_9ACTN